MDIEMLKVLAKLGMIEALQSYLEGDEEYNTYYYREDMEMNDEFFKEDLEDEDL